MTAKNYDQSISVPLTHAQMRAVWSAFSDWFRIRREFEPRFRELFPDEAAIRQLDADIWHSALLERMLVHGKEPLPKPPRTEHSYPVYDDLLPSDG